MTSRLPISPCSLPYIILYFVFDVLLDIFFHVLAFAYVPVKRVVLYTAELLCRLRIRTWTIALKAWRGTFALQPRESKLLTLPVEVRLRIWSAAVGGEYIVIPTKTGEAGLYRQQDEVRISDEDESDAVSKELDDEELIDSEPNAEHCERLTEWKKCVGFKGKALDGLGLIKTCKTIYAEAYPLLLSQSHFLITHNAALKKVWTPWTLSFPLLPHIRTLHIHFSFIERSDRHDDLSNYPRPTLSNLDIYAKCIAEIKSIAQLRDLSIYIEGPLASLDLYRHLFHDFDGIAAHFGPALRHFTVHVPLPVSVSAGFPIHARDMGRLYTEPVLEFLSGWRGTAWKMVLAETEERTTVVYERLDRRWREGVLFREGEEVVVRYQVRGWYSDWNRWEMAVDEREQWERERRELAYV